MARYYPVSPLYWTDSKVQSWSRNAALLGLYLLTCEHRNLEGLYRLPYAYAQTDLDWTHEEISDAMAELVDSGFVAYDHDARVVFLPKALKYHQPKSPTQIQGAINALQSVPDTVLFGAFVDAAREYAPTLYRRLEPAESESSFETVSEPSPESYETPSTNGI